MVNNGKGTGSKGKYTVTNDKVTGFSVKLRHILYSSLPYYKGTFSPDYYVATMQYTSILRVVQHGLLGKLSNFVPYKSPRYSANPAERFVNWLVSIIPHYLAWWLGYWDVGELADNYDEAFACANRYNSGVWFNDDFACVTNPIVRVITKLMFSKYMGDD